jgi:hypothetical protein
LTAALEFKQVYIFSVFVVLFSSTQILKYVPGRGLQFCNILLIKQRRIEVERGRALVWADDVCVLGENSVP